MTDFNLYGCDYIDSSTARFRSPVPEYDQGSNASHLWHSRSVPMNKITDDFALPRVSHCSIEVDICVQDIVNRTTVKERQLHHNFVERIKPLPLDIKLVTSMAGLWKDETKRRKRQMGNRSQGSGSFPPEVLVSMSANPRDLQAQNWIHEDEYREQIRDLICGERDGDDTSDPSFDTFATKTPLEDTVKTVSESIDDLFPSNLMPALGLPSGIEEILKDPASSIVVDERRVLQFGEGYDDFFPDDSDEEALTMLESAEKTASNGEKTLKQQTGDHAGEIAISEESVHDVGLLPLESILGICQSGCESGKLPTIPLHKELLDAAGNDGLIGRALKPGQSHLKSNLLLKRSASGLSSTQGPIKRLKTDEPCETQKNVGGINTRMPSQSLSMPLPDDTSFRNQAVEPVRKVSLKQKDATGTNQLLNFPVVKDQNDPSTKLRLSQLSQVSQMSSSPKTEDAGIPKHVSFEPSTLVGFNGQFKSQKKSPSASHMSGVCDEESQIIKLQQALTHLPNTAMLIFSALPPSSAEVVSSFSSHNIPDVIYQDAYYSKEKDVPNRTREYAGREFRLEGNTLPFLPDFDPTGISAANYGLRRDSALDKTDASRKYNRQRRNCTWRSWEFADLPPTYEDVKSWWEEKQLLATSRPVSSQPVLATPTKFLSQIDGPTPKNKHGFKYTQKKKTTSVEHEVQYMSTMSLEIHVNTRGKFVPNPEEDEVQCIFWALKSDETVLNSQDSASAIRAGILVRSGKSELAQRVRRQTSVEVIEEVSELDLIVRMVEIVRTHDPDVLTGYEVHSSSWGYLIERARFKYDYNLCDEFSRMKTESHGRFGKENDKWGFNTTSTIRVTGRHMINIWRAMRGELNLLQYTMENVAWHLLHRRIPHYPWKTLTNWYQNGKHRDLDKLLRYYQSRTRLDIEILDANELIARTSEQARLLGVDFFSVFSRGSQFKVESIMFRIAKPENFLLVSPSRKQVGGQNALECLPLVMEPQSAFYNSPVLVLDFQSLYPSVMIAYNYCYSTFLGRIVNWRGMNKMGFTEYKRQRGLLALLEDYINIAPNGIMYAKTEVRKSLLAKMLTEILETRVMVKSGMKQDKDDKTLQQLLNNRQLALKLLANVTYGYTSASFSGRMPCSEIADSIVQTARETLERAIAFVHSVERWGAEVVYGDTDSIFIHLKGRTKDQAFDIGNEISKAITDMNPRPIKLKFEKVYYPCVLLAKKRYVGYKYESKGQIKPDFDAKGIETVRRDGTPAEQKIEEKTLRLLFETADLSQIKSYFQQQCEKIMRNTVSVQDFCFAKEVRLGTYSDKGPPPAGALISTKRMLEDVRAEPQYGERVPYVVITGAPGARLIDRCVAPEELLSNPHWQLDAEYYINKNLIPPLERIFNLVGANVRQWYDEMPKVQRVHHATNLGTRKTTLESYMKSTHCLVCNVKFTHEENPLCPTCRDNVPASLLALQTKLSAEERKFEEVQALCRSCSGIGPLEEVNCDSKDCAVFWTRMRQRNKMKGERNTVRPVIRGLVEGMERVSLDW